MFSELDARVGFHLKQLENGAFLGVIRLRRIARSRADAPVAFPNQVFVGKLFVLSVTPRHTHLLVQVLGKRLGQSVTECLDQNRMIIVVLRFVLVGDFLDLRPCGDGKCAQIISAS